VRLPGRQPHHEDCKRVWRRAGNFQGGHAASEVRDSQARLFRWAPAAGGVCRWNHY
ncbi:unnamed protein product, partial [Symbiodinium pilosum]